MIAELEKELRDKSGVGDGCSSWVRSGGKARNLYTFGQDKDGKVAGADSLFWLHEPRSPSHPAPLIPCAAAGASRRASAHRVVQGTHPSTHPPPPPRLRTIPTAGCAVASLPHPPPSLPAVWHYSGEIWGAALSRTRAQSGRRHPPRGAPARRPPPRAAPLRRCHRSESSGGNARRQAHDVQHEETLQQAMLAQMGRDRAGVDSVVHDDADGFSSPPSSAPLPLRQNQA
ncbi:uncharacterized protein [Triticum aestivum]|uniref:uncharacterized protein n=1 Tax=Triticum aestivum TaxID=4565 RepID=UPI001D0113F6|nr:uncharacterized protein LOC123138964 [Triticum aestivum]